MNSSLLTQIQNDTASEIGMDIHRVATESMTLHGNDPKALQVLAGGIATGIEALNRDHPQLLALVSNMLLLKQSERFNRDSK